MAGRPQDRPGRSASAPAHRPVMPREVLSYLAPSPGRTVVDATVGCAGHARQILPRLLPGGCLIGVDRDPRMLAAARDALSAFPRASYRLFEASYDDLPEVLKAVGVPVVDGMLLDAGFCSAQMDDPERGLSYRADGPLDMRYAPEGPTAADLLARLDAEALERLFRDYGEERWARRIARAVVGERRRSPLQRTGQLAALIERAVPGGRRRLHPARRVFQALRIAVNDELARLERFLDVAPPLLAQGGRLVLLTYHSLEDRRAKDALRRAARDGVVSILTRRVVRPRPDEVQANPRARSARLRAALCIRTGGSPSRGRAPAGGGA